MEEVGGGSEGSKPPSVSGGIHLSAKRLAPTGTVVPSETLRPHPFGIIAHARLGIVSAPLPGLSPCAFRHPCFCGGGTFLSSSSRPSGRSEEPAAALPLSPLYFFYTKLSFFILYTHRL